MKSIRMAIALSACAALTACAGFPPYQPPPAGPDVATIDLSRFNADSICTGGELYSIRKVEGDKLLVPTTSRVALYSWVYISDYYMNYSCMPGVSFQPVAGETYLMNLELDSKACHAEVYRHSPDSRVGLDLVYSEGPPALCQ